MDGGTDSIAILLAWRGITSTQEVPRKLAFCRYYGAPLKSLLAGIANGGPFIPLRYVFSLISLSGCVTLDLRWTPVNSQDVTKCMLCESSFCFASEFEGFEKWESLHL